MRIILLGPPGAGKGTQAENISNNFNIKKISTGDLFRSHIKKNTELGKIAKEYYVKGDLVPDKIPTDMVKEWIFNQTDTGWLLDGFPRNIKQAESLNRILDSINSNIDAVLLINVNTELLIKDC